MRRTMNDDALLRLVDIKIISALISHPAYTTDAMDI